MGDYRAQIECPVCGLPRQGDPSSTCRGLPGREHEPQEWRAVEYVRADLHGGAVEENRRLRAAIAADGRTIADLRKQLAASDQAIRDHFDRERGQ